MDAEHRHELKTNELADWIAHIPDFVRKNYLQIIGIILIIIAILLWAPLKGMHQSSNLQKEAQTTGEIEKLLPAKATSAQNMSQNMGASNSILVTANALEMEASEAKNPLLAALVLVKRGEALRADLHYKSEEVQPQVVRSQTEQARKAYTEAISKAQEKAGGSSLIATAKFGLGLCAEELGEYNRAEEIYKAIVDDPQFEGTISVAQAQLRLETMDDHKGKFVFAKTPEPTIELPIQLPGTDAPQTPAPEQTFTDIVLPENLEAGVAKPQPPQPAIAEPVKETKANESKVD